MEPEMEPEMEMVGWYEYESISSFQVARRFK